MSRLSWIPEKTIMVPSLRRRLITVCVLVIVPLMKLLAGAASGQALPTVATTKIDAAVVSSSDVLTFAYTVTNPRSNTGSVWLVNLDIARVPGGIALSSDGLTNDDRFFLNGSKTVLAQRGADLVPVGVQTPVNWNGGLTLSGTVQWGASDSTPLIAPGSSLGGFQVTSRGLPGLRTMSVAGHLDLDAMPIREPSDPSDLPRYVAERAAREAKITASTTTVGPTAPPLNFNSRDFLQTIINYKGQATQQGWIKNRGIGISLDAKLSAARAAMARGDKRAATNILKSLIREVEDSDRDDRNEREHERRQLSPEAVALLKFNTKYLIEQIEDPRHQPGRDGYHDERTKHYGNPK